ncbi:ATP-binding cassette domain-containing protein [Reinekea thalattae]|uniref:ATP-binding cassette domain-containing protein n=2 Tax=Reinekea thalattae TaxID=2593301 RepID=A0A5C8Z9S2_9GAMM|nr:ATP-binding cassette domain-containing protein [Reinekea thalattae]
MSLWYWFYLTAYWLEDWLNKADTPYPYGAATLSIGLFIAFRLLHIQTKKVAGLKLNRLFYQQLVSQLSEKRWSLIRSKPQTAWQDVLFRHLPAFEQYLLEYEVQRMLIGIIPLIVLTVITPISWLAALTLFVTLPLIPLFMWLVGMGAAKIHSRHIRVLNHLGQFFYDRIAGQSSVRLFNQQQAQLDRFNLSSNELNRRLADVVKVAFLSSSTLDFFSTVAMALLAVFIGFSLLEEITIGFWQAGPSLGSGLFILLIAPAFFAELKNLGRLYHVKAEAVAGAESWWQVLTSPSVESNPLTPSQSLDEFDSLVIKAASVSGIQQSDTESLLRFNDLSLHSKDRVLLTGSSGSGKTVLLDVIAGLRQLDASLIELNGQSQSNLVALRPKVLYLSQTPDLTSGSIRDNVGLQQCSDDDIVQAIEQVGLSDWLNAQANGLDTLLGDFAPLSGGQRQRLALTRLVLFNASIVLLDEPLAHTSEDEHASLLQLMLRLTEHRASIWISHKTIAAEHFNQTWHINAGELTPL